MRFEKEPRVALVHDWLTGMRGGERCLEVFCKMFPEADLYTLFYSPQKISQTISSHSPVVSVLQRLPFAGKYYRHLLPAYFLGIKDLGKKLDAHHCLENYDIVISISHCAAKNIEVPDSVVHLSYCLTPMRYLWDQYDAYFFHSPFEPAIRRVIALLKRWDVARSDSVTKFVAISKFVESRIKRAYRRDAQVIYPPVRTDWIESRSPGERGEGFLCVNALVPYKNIHIIIQAFNLLGLPLTIVGNGPQKKYFKKLAKPNIEFLDFVSDKELALLYRKSRALVFAAEEDFGMTPVEMQAAGRPVIALGRGGSLETVCSEGSYPTGIFFFDLSVDSLCEAVQAFIEREEEFTANNCQKQASQFSCERFEREFWDLLDTVMPGTFQRAKRAVA